MWRKIFWLVLPMVMVGQQTLRLEQCLAEAMKNNLALRRQENARDSVHAFRQSIRAQFFPSIDFSGTYLRLNKQFSLFENDVFLPIIPYMAIDQQTGRVDPEKFKDPLIAATYLVIDPQTMQPVLDKDGNPIFRNYAWLPADQAKLGVKDNYLLQFTLKQPVFVGGKIWYGYKIAQHLEEIYDVQKEVSKEALAFEVIEKYMQLVVTWKRLKLIQQYKTTLSKIMDDLANYFHEGIVTELELQQARVKYNEVVLNELQASQGFTLLQMVLNQKMGRPFSSYWLPEDTALALPGMAMDTTSLLENAMASRHELKLLDEQIRIQSYQKKMAKGEMLPQIGFLANYLIMKPSPYQGFKNVFDSDYQLGVSVTIPLVHAGEKWYKTQMTNLAWQNSLLMKQEAEDLIKLDVLRAYFAYNEALQNVEVVTAKVQEASLALQQTTDKFHVGMVKVADLLQAQTNWFHAEVSRLDAIASAWVAYYQLLKASGNLKL